MFVPSLKSIASVEVNMPSLAIVDTANRGARRNGRAVATKVL